jgi:hypothetical protein
MMKGAFDEVRLTENGTLHVSGPLEEKADARLLSVVVTQDGASAEGVASVSGDRWVGEIPATGFTAGKPVLAVGIAVLVGDGAVQSFTWCEHKQLVQG